MKTRSDFFKSLRLEYVGRLFFGLLILGALTVRAELRSCVIGYTPNDTTRTTLSDSLVMESNTVGFSDSGDNVLLVYGFIHSQQELSVSIAGGNDSIGRAETGLMIRTDTSATSAFISCASSLQYGTIIRYRLNAGEKTTIIPVSARQSKHLVLRRDYGYFRVYYTPVNDSVPRPVSMVFSLRMPTVVAAGLYHTSNYRNNSWAVLKDPLGFSLYDKPQAGQVIKHLFPPDSSLSQLGFTHNGYWHIDSLGHARTIPTDSGAVLSCPPFEVTRRTGDVDIFWDAFFTSDTSALYGSPSLYGSSLVRIGDRSRIAGALLSSGDQMYAGADSRIDASLASANTITAYDRAYINGSLRAQNAVTLHNDVTVTGTVITGDAVAVPRIPVKSLTVGAADITVNPGDTIDLAPGRYNRFQCYAQGVVYLHPGEYTFTSFICEPDVIIYVTGGRDDHLSINTQEQFRIGDRCKMVCNGGIDGTSIGIYSNQTWDMYIGTDVALSGALTVPHSAVRFSSRDAVLNGSAYAREVTVEPDANLNVFSPYRGGDSLIVTIGSDQGGTDYYRLGLVCGTVQSESTAVVKLMRNTTVLADSALDVREVINRRVRLGVSFTSLKGDGAGYISAFIDNGSGPKRYIHVLDSSFDTFDSLAFLYGSEAMRQSSNFLYVDSICIIAGGSLCDSLYFVTEPADTTVFAGTHLVLEAKAEGAESYQWYKDGGMLAGEISELLPLGVMTQGDSASQYWCRIANGCDTVTGDTALVLVEPCDAPVIIGEPEDVVTQTGRSVRFGVEAHGYGLTYTWWRNDEVVGIGIGLDTLLVPSVSAWNHGDEYRVTVSNACGDAVGGVAYLSINGDATCAILSGPVSDTVEEGYFYIAEATVSCPTANFTWLHNDTVISGSRQLVFGPVDTSNSGDVFTFILDNGFVVDTSAPAILTVTARAPSSGIVAISGELLTATGEPEGKEDTVAVPFRVRLFTSPHAGEPVYTEWFNRNKSVVVIDGEYTVHLGGGRADNDLQTVAAQHEDLFAELAAGVHHEVLGRRVYLSAAPRALSTGKRVYYGYGQPGGGNVEAPLGTLYVDKADGDATWIKAENGWKQLD